MKSRHNSLVLALGLLFLMGAFWPFCVLAATYHVSTAACASDENDGSSPACGAQGHGPWRDIDEALKRLSPGDTLFLEAGIYSQHWISLDKAGIAGSPITLAASVPHKAIIDGSGAPASACGLFIEKDAAHLVLDGLVVRNMPGNGIASDDTTKKHFQNITVKRCILEDNGLSGLELAAVQNFLVQDVTARNNDYYGIHVIGSKDGSLDSSHGRIERCVCDNHTGPEGHGLAINQGQHIIVSECQAAHNRIHGFDVSDWPKKGLLSSNISFLKNIARDNGKAGFAVNSDSSNVLYQRNAAWNNGASWASDKLAPGFWCYEGCRDVTWRNNTSVGNSNSGFHVEGAAGLYDGKPPSTTLTFVNNIAWDNGQEKWNETYGLFVEKAGWQLVLKNNNFGATAGGEARMVGLEMVGDEGRTFTQKELEAGRLPQGNMSRLPGFINQNAGDFRLLPDSPMRDAGAMADMKHCGKAPDIGAFELCP